MTRQDAHLREEESATEQRVRSELATYVADIEPSAALRARVRGLANLSSSTTKSSRSLRWRTPVLVAAAVIAIAATSVTLIERRPDSATGTTNSQAPVPFAAESAPDLQEDSNRPPAVIDQGFGHETPTAEFRAAGEATASAIETNDYQTLLALQSPAALQPNTTAGLLSFYGGRALTTTEFDQSTIASFPYAWVTYTVNCGSKGETIQFDLRFAYAGGRWVLYPQQQQESVPEPANTYTNSSMAVDSRRPTMKERTLTYPPCKS